MVIFISVTDSSEARAKHIFGMVFHYPRYIEAKIENKPNISASMISYITGLKMQFSEHVTQIKLSAYTHAVAAERSMISSKALWTVH